MFRTIFKLTIAFSAIGFVLAAGAFAEPGPGVSFVHPTEGMVVTESTGGATLDFTDSVSVGTQHCKLDDAPYGSCDSVRNGQHVLRNGAHSYQVRTLDSDGDIHVEIVNFTVNDVTPPSFTASVVDGNPVFDRPRFDIGIADAYAIVVATVDGRGPERFTMWGPGFEWSPESVPNGEYDVLFRVYDAAMNVSTQTVSIDVSDSTAPTVTIDNPSEGENFVSGTISADFSTDDPNARYTCSIDDSAAEYCHPDATQFYDLLADGAHAFTVNALDSSGNNSTTTHYFTVDGPTATGLSIDQPSNGSTYAAQPRLDIDSVVPIVFESLRCSVNGGAFAICAVGDPIAAIDRNGSWTLTVRAENTNGDRVQAQSSFVVADSTGPAVSFGPGPYMVADVDEFTLPGTITDDYADSSPSQNVVTRCAVDSAPLTDCISAILGPQLGLAPTMTFGAHTITVQSGDWVGNTSSAQFDVDVTDITGPVIEILSPTSGTTVAGGGLTIDFHVDTVDFFGEPTMCQIDSEPAVKCSESELDGVRSWTPVGLTPGLHTITVSRSDIAGNSSSDAISITVTDATAPSISFLAPTAGSTLTDQVSLIFATDEKVVSIRCAVDGAAFVTDADQCSTFSDDRRSGFFRPTAITAGVHNLWIEATDVHGNVTEASLEVTVADTTAPDVRFDTTFYGDAPAGADSPKEISFSSTDLSASFSCALDGGSSYACGIGRSSTELPPLTNGGHSLLVTATDANGNTGAATMNFSVNDATPPPLEVTGLTEGMAVGANVTADVTSSETGATTTCAINAGAFTACGIDHQFTFTSSGAYTLRFRATDVAGNATNETFAVTATVTVPPTGPPGGTQSEPTPPGPPPPASATVTIAKPTTKVTTKTTTLKYSVLLALPVGVDINAACKGNAATDVKVGKKIVARAKPALKIVRGKCTIAGSLKIKSKLIAGKKFKLGVTFAGNAQLKTFYSSRQGKTGRAK